jgi:O-antigen/teichoic acid export membrane protein
LDSRAKKLTMVKHFKSLFKGTVIYGLMGSLRTFIEFLLLPIYARFLLPADFGTLDILVIFITIGTVASILELFNAVFRFYFDENSNSFKKKVISTATFSVMVNGAIIFTLAMIFSRSIASAVLNSPELSHLFILAGAYIMLDASLTIPLSLTRIENKPGKYAFIAFLQIGILLIGIFIFVIILKWGVIGIMTSKVISIILPMMVCFYWARGYIGLDFDFGLLKSMLKFSIPLIPAGAAIWGINSLNRVFMLHYLTLDQIGLFSIGSKFVVLITLSMIAFQLAWPHFAFSNMNSKNASKMFGQVFNIFAAFGICLVLFLTMFAEPLIQIATAPDFYLAASVILPLSLGMFLYGLFFFFTTGVVISKTTKRIIPPITIAVIVNIILNNIITPRYGFVGTAWVTTATYLIMAVSMFLFSQKSGYLVLEWRRLIRLAIPSAVVIAIGTRLSEFNSVYFLGVKAFMFLTFPVLLILSGFIDQEYKQTLKQIISPTKIQKKSEKEECAELLVE